jgi:DNA invertase Pin-like site-specific DNA recombinase
MSVLLNVTHLDIVSSHSKESAMKRYIAYYRVSTAQQGKSGLGLDAQLQAVQSYLGSDYPDSIIAEYQEIESGKNASRPQLNAALTHCKLANATLLIAKLDRLSRSIGFIAKLQDSGTKFLCADMPEANETMINFMSVMAQAERKLISERTKAALEQAKKRGVKLGNPNLARVRNTDTSAAREAHINQAQSRNRDLLKVILSIKQENASHGLQALANELNSRGFLTARGKPFHKTSVSRILNTF